MNTTTELAQQLKSRAELAKKWGARNPKFTADEVLALVEALEAKEEQRANWFQMAEKLGYELDVAEKRNAEPERRVTELEGMNAASAKYGMKVANSRDKLRNRISELNSYHTAYIEWLEKTEWMQKDILRFKSVQPLGKHRADVLREYIEYLESRAVTVTLPEYRNSPDMHTKEYYETIGFNQGLDACIDALRAAGVAVEGE